MFELSGRANDLIERIRALQPDLSECAPFSEKLRRSTDAQVDMLGDTGVYGMLVPESHGGLELDVDAFVEVGLALGEADISMAWVTNFYIEHNFLLCLAEEPFQNSVYSDGESWVLAAAVNAPTGASVPVEGGYRVTGRWKWGTGIAHSSWVLVNTLIADESPGAPTARMVWIPKDEVHVEDTWHVSGMVGTGSHDIVVEDVFVPVDRTMSMEEILAGAGPGAKLHAAPLYKTPMVPVLMLAAALPIVGHAGRVARDFNERLKVHVPMAATGSRTDDPAAQMRLAQAQFEADQAALTLRAIAADVMAIRENATPLDRTRWACSITLAVHQARRTILDVSEASGASAQNLSHPLQRAVRDVNAATTHVAFNRDNQRQSYAKHLLGKKDIGFGLF
ncbi:MAG: acyl-CoA dehydrogenase [Pseudomonadota bacterium]